MLWKKKELQKNSLFKLYTKYQGFGAIIEYVTGKDVNFPKFSNRYPKLKSVSG